MTTIIVMICDDNDDSDSNNNDNNNNDHDNNNNNHHPLPRIHHPSSILHPGWRSGRSSLTIQVALKGQVTGKFTVPKMPGVIQLAWSDIGKRCSTCWKRGW